MTINLADNNPRIAYSVAEGVTQTVFSVPFEFFEDADVNVYVDGVLKAEGTDYTLTGGEGSTGTLTFVTADPGETQQVTGATGGSTVVLFRRVALERTTDFQTGQDINRSALNEQLDVLTALAADMNDRIDRSIHLNDYDTDLVNFVLPPREQRIGNYFAFDLNGDPVMTTGTTSTLIVSSFVETLLDDGTAADFLNTLGITAPVADINNITGVTASATELNLLDGVTGTLVTEGGTQTLTNKTLTAPAISSPTFTGTPVEDVYALSGTTPALDPDNGSIQTWTLTANSTPTDSLSAGEAITLMIDDGTAYTITWPTMTWVNNAGAAPTLATSGYTVVALWKVGSTLYGALVGDGS